MDETGGKEAKLVRTLQSRVGNMCDTKFKQMPSANGLKNALIRPEHVTNATCMFGPITAALEGTRLRRPSTRVLEDGGGVTLTFLMIFIACTTL